MLAWIQRVEYIYIYIYIYIYEYVGIDAYDIW